MAEQLLGKLHLLENLVSTYIERSEYQQALHILDNSLKNPAYTDSDPANALIFELRMKVYHLLGKDEKAYGSAVTSLRYGEGSFKNAESYLIAGNIHQKRNEIQTALVLLEDGLLEALEDENLKQQFLEKLVEVRDISDAARDFLADELETSTQGEGKRKGKEKEKGKGKETQHEVEEENKVEGEGDIKEIKAEGEIKDEAEVEEENKVEGEGDIKEIKVEGEIKDEAEGEIKDEAEGKIKDEGEGEIKDEGEKENMDEKKTVRTLTSWLRDVKERWSTVHENWNSMASKQSNKMDGIQGWKASRPTEICCALIKGIIKSVLHSYEELGLDYGHGCLNHTDNYLLSLRHTSHTGIRVQEVDVQLVHSVVQSRIQPVDIITDFIDVHDTLMKILQIDNIKDLPNIWQHLFKKIKNLTSESFVEKLSKNPEERKIVFESLKDHPALWGWRIRIGYYDCLWRTLKEEKMSAIMLKKPSNLQSAIKHVLGTLNSVATNLFQKFPSGTPYASFLSEGAYGYSADELLRYIRNLHIHLYEKSTSGEECFKYFCSSPSITNDLLTTDNSIAEYNEVVTCELFSPFLTSLHEHLIKNTWSQELFIC